MKTFLCSLLLSSIALGLLPVQAKNESTTNPQLEKAMFGMGCFWKTQYIFSKQPGVVKTTVGYSGGKTKNPSYENVCSHSTGHAEVAQIEFDPQKTSYKKLVETFFAHHDPTTLNRQGPDVGDNYRSVIFYSSEKQKEEATQVKAELAQKFRGKIVTQIEPAGEFYPAEDYHQDYFVKHGQVCH